MWYAYKSVALTRWEILMNLAEKIIDIRNQAGLTQDAFAKKLHLTRQAVSRWENGETTPPVETVKKILEIFNIDANSFFFGSICQSCSCPLHMADPYGTNADKGVSTEYCGYCFQGGEHIGYKTIDEAVADSVNYLWPGNTPEEKMAEARKVLSGLRRWSGAN